MRVLFADHECHRKTRSADFFLEILRERFELDLHYYSACYDCLMPDRLVERADIVVFWEFLPGRRDICIPGKPCVFVPMYDNEWGSKWQWRRIARSGMGVISFCDAVAAHAKSCGVENVLSVHYAPDPGRLEPSSGDPRKALYWNRGNFSERQIRSLFADGAIDELSVQTGFMPREEYDEFSGRFGVCVAPRRKEGIGMAFLEQLARGNCVIAHDDATMNEYIADGANGILLDFDKPKRKISAGEIAAVRKNARAFAFTARKRWLAERDAIAPFLMEAAKTPCAIPGRFGDWLRFAAYLAEGTAMRIFR